MNTSKSFRILHSLLILPFLIASASGAVLTLDFSNGNGNTSVDQYLGIAGSGWNTAWSQSFGAQATSPAATVANTTPLSAGGGNYLQLSYDSAGAGGTVNGRVSRQLNSAAIDLAQPFTIDFFFRPDAAVGSSSQSLVLFGDSNAISTTGATNSWRIDGTGAGWLAGGTVTTGVAITAGTTYHFTISLTPNATTPSLGVYTVAIDNLGNGIGNDYTSGTLPFRASATLMSTSFLNFVSNDGNTATANTGLGFSVDQISAVPEPSTVPMLIAAASAFLFRRKQRSSRVNL